MKLTTRQKNTLKKHQETHGHTKAHMDYMKRKMREGMSFTDAHRLAMRRKGKGVSKGVGIHFLALISRSGRQIIQAVNHTQL